MKNGANMRKHAKRLSVLTLAVNMLVVGAASGAERYGSGDKTWDAASTNWGTNSGGPYTITNWNNATPDSAIFEGTAGTVALGEPITVSNLTFNLNADNYIIGGNTLTFVGGGAITQAYKNRKHTITSAINGSPDVGVINGAGYEGLTFAPSSGSVMLGTLTVPYDDPVGGDKAGLHLAGTTTGNSVGKVRFDGGDKYGAIYKDGSGTWALGDVDIGIVYLNAGDLVVNGTIRTWYAGLQLKGGTFHYNNAGAVTAHQGLNFNGGSGAVSLDNSSGAAITNSIYNPPQSWAVDWTFMGSQGTNSDLEVGAGAVTLTGDRTVSVSNALTTLTVSGVIGDGTAVRGLTKAGAGTLKLTGANTYEGSTTVNGGSLHITQPFLADGGILSVTNGAMLHLDFSGTDTVLAVVFDGAITDAGTWGAPGSGADHTTNLLSGAGLLKHNGGQVADGLWFWDGPNTNGTGNGACDGGSGVWSSSVTNWDHGLVTRKAWSGATNDFVFFRKVAGTVDLQSDITLGGMLIDGVDNYVIGSTPEAQAMTFGGMNSITVKLVKATFRAGITGSPDLHLHGDSSDQLYMYPDSASMTLGNVTVGGGAGAGNNPVFYLGGSTTGNTIAKVINGNNWSRIFKQGTGTWTVGDVAIGGLNIQAGRLVVNGTYNPSYPPFHTFTGGTLAGTGTINHVLTVPAGGAVAPGDPTGTLTVTNNNCAIAGTLAIALDGAQHGKLVVDGDLDITGATLDVTTTSAPTGQFVILAKYGSLIGTFDTINGVASSARIVYDHAGGTAIALIPGPRTGIVFVVR
jgi:autotransporter-associated beta strand protein